MEKKESRYLAYFFRENVRPIELMDFEYSELEWKQLKQSHSNPKWKRPIDFYVEYYWHVNFSLLT